MQNIRRRLFGASGTVIAAALVAAIAAWPGLAQEGKTVITRSWDTDAPAPASEPAPFGARTAARPSAVSATAVVRPAITRDVDGPDRQPRLKDNNFWSHFNGLYDGGTGCGKGFAGLVAGGRMIIELVSVKIVSPTPLQGPYIALGTSATGTLGVDESSAGAIFIALQPQGKHAHLSGSSVTADYYHYVGTQAVRLRVDSTDWLCESIYTGSAFVSAEAHVSYFGYQLDPP